MTRWPAWECCGSPRPNTQGQCGYGPRQPLVVISPYAKENYVDHRVTDQSSILRFIEDNWNLGRVGENSSDVKAGTLNGMFDFDDNRQQRAESDSGPVDGSRAGKGKLKSRRNPSYHSP